MTLSSRSNRGSPSSVKILMLGSDLSNKGGIASVQQTYLRAWDHRSYWLKHVRTNKNGPWIRKLGIFIKALLTVTYLLIVWKPHIVHIHFSVNASFYRKSVLVVLAKIARVRIILHCHAPDFDIFYENRSRLGQYYVRYILNSSNLLIVVADYWRRYFEHISIDVAILTLYNPVFPPNFLETNRNNSNVILFLGQLVPRKGIGDILKAIPHVLAKQPNARFYFGGDGDIQYIRNIISNHSWGKNIEILGWVAGEAKEKAFAQASLFLLPSYHEGLPVAILEAMSYGLPVISTPVGGIPELVLDGETGYLVKPGDIDTLVDKICLLLSNVELRRKMGIKGHQQVLEHFTVSVVMPKLFSSYASLINSN